MYHSNFNIGISVIYNLAIYIAHEYPQLKPEYQLALSQIIKTSERQCFQVGCNEFKY